MLIRLYFAMAGALGLSASVVPGQDAAPAGLWNTGALTAPAAAVEWGPQEKLTQQVWYAGEPFEGHPTRIFAWLGRPANPQGKSPALLLVHGGGGQAFKDWAQHWAERGYVALAMDTAGQGPDGKPHAHAGPGQSDAVKFQSFQPEAARNQWSYHAAAAVMRGHGVLKSLPDVDTARVGITGISWGGYLTCLIAGLDHELKVAVPVYGCGFLGDNSWWRDRDLARLPQDSRARWLSLFDPSTTVAQTKCPILFLNGTHDFAYPPDSYRKAWSLVRPELRTLAVRVDLHHGHIWTYGEVDAFVDHVLQPGPDAPPLVRLGEITHDDLTARAAVLPGSPALSAELHWTSATGAWQTRQWTTVPATLAESSISAALPADGPVSFFFTAKDARGLITSSGYSELRTGPNNALIPTGKLENDFYDWEARHAAVMKQKSQSNPDTVMIGDSITHLWGGLPAEPRGDRSAASWDKLFAGKSVINMGFGFDRTQNVLGRLERGELDGIQPRAIVLHIGTNNLPATPAARANTPEEIAEAIESILLQCKARCPKAKLILMALMPRGEKPDHPLRIKTNAVNALLPAVAKSAGAILADVTPQLLAADGTYTREMAPDALHPSAAGYAEWAKLLQPLLP